MNGSKVFIPLDSLQSNGSGSYSYIDKAPLSGMNYYRLLQNDPYHQVSYSGVVSIDENNGVADSSPFTVYPNPATSVLNIQLTNPNQANVTIRVTNMMGRVVINRSSAAANIKQEVSSLQPGDYILQVIDANQNVIGTKKFIKR
jgi:trimeric autotransporter adhesin